MEKVWAIVPDCSDEDEHAVSEFTLKLYSCLHEDFNVNIDWIKLKMFNSLRYDDEAGELSRKSIIVDKIFDILNLNEILQLIENFKTNKDLLFNIEYDKNKFKELDMYIDKNIDSNHVFISFWIFNILEFLYIACKLKRENKNIKLFARTVYN